MSRRIRTLLGVAAVLVAATGATAASVADRGPTAVVAVFPDASPLRTGNEVKAHGVRVGLIERIDLVDGRAHVRAEVDPGVLPLHDDATAAIRPVSLLGERYLELDVGTAAAPVAPPAADGTVVIPAERTSRAVDLDDLLDTLDDPTSAALAALVTTLGEGSAGRGDDIAAAIAALDPALGRTDRLVEILRAQNEVLGRAVDLSAQSLAAVADDDGNSLDRLLGTTRATLTTVADNRVAVNDALGRLPGTLTSARGALTELAGTAEATTPVLRDLRPFTAQLGGLSTELTGFADAAEPALAALPPVLDRVDTLLDPAAPVAQALRPAADDLRGVAGALRALGDELLVHDPGVSSHLENLMSGVADWAMATSGRDGVSHYFRGAAVATPETLRALVAASAPAGAVPPTAPVLPPAPGVPQSLLAPGTSADPDGAAPDAADPDGVTGLSPEQEQGLFGQLLGGGGGR